MVYAPEWANSSLRMELFRRKSPRARVGGMARVSNRAANQGQGGSRISGARVSQAVAEFYVVGEPERSRRPERFRGRISRAGQYWDFRPLHAHGAGNVHRSVRWHELDGDVLPGHAGDRGGTCAPGPGIRGCGQQIL